MKKWIFLLLILVGLACAVGSLAMTILAAQYWEWGRVLLYGVMLIFSLELFGFGLYQFLKFRKSKEEA